MYDDSSALGVLPGTTGNVDAGSAWPIAGDAGVVYGLGTGQHGVSPQPSNGGGAMGAITSFWSWLNKPFTTPMSPTTIFLVAGVIILSILAWNLILYHVRIAAESI